MLAQINKYYIIFCSCIYILLFTKIDVDDYTIYFTNFFSIITFFVLINYLLGKTDSFFNRRNLTILCFLYATFYVFIYNLISYSYRGNFLVFSEIDPLFYHNEAIRFASNTFTNSINYFLRFYLYDDIGIVVVFGFLYKILESNLIVDLFHIVVGLITARAIYRIARYSISKKYSFLCALIYSLSSFTLWFHSSAHKESFMVMIIVLIFDQYYKLQDKITFKNVVIITLLLLTLLLFRPILIFFCIVSFGLALFLKKKMNSATVFLILSIGITFLFSFSFVFDYVSKQLYSGDADMFFAYRDALGMIKGSVEFTYAVNILASLLGPFPSFNPSQRDLPSLSFLSGGLTFRLLLSVAFLLGSFYIIKLKEKSVYAILFFAAMEMFSLTVIFESLELRKSLPHFPMIYILSFWFLDKLENNEFFSHSKRECLKRMYGFLFIPLFFIILYWNFR